MDSRLINDILSELSLSEGMKVLDVGCGCGEFTRLFLEWCLLPVVMTGVDCDIGILPKAGEGITFTVEDVYRLPVEDNELPSGADTQAIF